MTTDETRHTDTRHTDTDPPDTDADDTRGDAAPTGAERRRLAERGSEAPWQRWGPYLSERQWGTVREDLGRGGDAWGYFPHDHARSRAYRSGEDGLAGISDDRQLLCFALALWNGEDPILKERLFGLTNAEGNHGEDVKEYYFYVDSTPTHSYMRYLYKYPHAAYPYEDLIATNRARGFDDLEYELIDTGVFDDDRYHDVVVEYAKAGPDDLVVAIEVTNRGPDPAHLHVLPTLWFRNTWQHGGDRPRLEQIDDLDGFDGAPVVRAEHPELGVRHLVAFGARELLFCENETNAERLFGTPNATPFVKDGIDQAIVHGRREAVDPDRRGTKVAAHYELDLAPGESRRIHVRLTDGQPADAAPASSSTDDVAGRLDALVAERRAEADEFYASVVPASLSDDARSVMRQALAGMLWTKQYYEYDVTRWLGAHGYDHRAALRTSSIRNREWFHMVNADIISMPDKFEYPWYAAWDLAFHAIPLATVDVEFAKQQLALMLDERYLHPNGQIPAYEWNFSDVNPPVHAWGVLNVYRQEQVERGHGDLDFLEEAFHKLTLNYTWWVNRKDPDGDDVFGGGFLGLDNIGVFDRSSPLPTGGHLEQSDGTAWMAFYALTMLEIAIELALHDDAYEPMAAKFFEHFLWIAEATDDPVDHQRSLWDDVDGFYYDVLVLPDGSAHRLKVRSLVGLLPLAACIVLAPDQVERLPRFMERVRWLADHRPDLVGRCPALATSGVADRRLLALMDETKLRRLLQRMLDEDEFLGPFGIRSLSRHHRDHPLVVHVAGNEYRVDYQPAESNTAMFGGNSNWRGPVWFPMNYLLVRGLISYAAYYGDSFTVECPTGSGREATLLEVAAEISERLTSIFLLDDQERRPVFGGTDVFQRDPAWRDHVPFYEYFHGDEGAGLGASHQTGWTGLVARLLYVFGNSERFRALAEGRISA